MSRPANDRGGEAPRLALLTLVLLWPAVPGCGRGEAPIADSAGQPSREAPRRVPPPPVQGKTAGTAGGPTLHAKIKVKDGSGAESFSIKPEHDGAKLVDASDREVARFNLAGDKLKIKDASDRVLGYVVGSKGRIRLKDPEQRDVLFELRRQGDGDWKLEDGRGALVYKIKRREYGFEIEDDRDRSHAKAKAKNGKVELRDAEDRVRYAASSEAVGPLPLACLGLDLVGDLPMKAGLLVRIALDERPGPTPEGGTER